MHVQRFVFLAVPFCSVATHVLHPMLRAERHGNVATTIVKQSKDRKGGERKYKKIIRKKSRRSKRREKRKEEEKR